MDAQPATPYSELAKTIPTAYEAVDIRREVYEILFPLKPELGPLP